MIVVRLLIIHHDPSTAERSLKLQLLNPERGGGEESRSAVSRGNYVILTLRLGVVCSAYLWGPKNKRRIAVE
jgi:hypothetical protein